MTEFVQLGNVYCRSKSIKSIALSLDPEDGTWDVIVRYKSSSDRDVCASFGNQEDAKSALGKLIRKFKKFCNKVQTDS